MRVCTSCPTYILAARVIRVEGLSRCVIASLIRCLYILHAVYAHQANLIRVRASCLITSLDHTLYVALIICCAIERYGNANMQINVQLQKCSKPKLKKNGSGVFGEKQVTSRAARYYDNLPSEAKKRN